MTRPAREPHHAPADPPGVLTDDVEAEAPADQARRFVGRAGNVVERLDGDGGLRSA
jgi:hypothetical protein